MFSGSITALVTPMFENGQIDFDSLETLIKRQMDAGTSAIVVNGTTGEAPTLTKDEQQKIIQMTVKIVNHQIPVIAGTGSYSTQKTIEETQAAMSLGVDACLIVTPCYNRPTQAGLYEHYKTVAKAVSIPLILYNVPSRTGCDLLPETVRKLADIANIVALKECVLTLPRIEELVYHCGNKINLLCGNDDEALPAMLLGFKGVISVVSNIVPELSAQLCELGLSGEKNNITQARNIYQKLLLLYQKLFIEPNPVPCKWLLAEMGLIPRGIRLPLVGLSEKYYQEVKEAYFSSIN